MASQQLTALAEYVLKARKDKGLSQPQLAKLCGLSSGWVGRLETGTLEGEPKLPTLEKLAKGLRVDVDELIRISRAGTTLPGIILNPAFSTRVDPGAGMPDPEFREFIQLLADIPPEKRSEALSYLRFLRSQSEEK